MAAIADAPTPTPTRSFVAALRAGAPHDAGSAITVAWHLATVRTWPIAPRVRARSFALVFALAAILATSSLATAAAVRVVVASGSEHERVIDHSGSGADKPVVVEPSPSNTPKPSPTSEPTRSAPATLPPAALPPTITGEDPGTSKPSRPSKSTEGGDQAIDDHGGTDDANDRSDAEDGDHSPDDAEEPNTTAEPDHESDGDTPDATSEPDDASGGGDTPDASDSRSTTDDGAGEPE